VPQSRFMLEDNAFAVHSVNSTHTSHAIVDWQGVVRYSYFQLVQWKQWMQRGNFGPPPATVDWLQPGYVPTPSP